ncbi:metal-dependent hydrolase [Halapricum hydrolyticum]|uniref:Metal-dependent hydrolase n=1 Tax=Halapricum hydrolyticum TaxID=2979991 RepID=A0AAE3ICU6_9EURY|nr:metal-dependent hydrolase [Halapricum hydrolyticum]MCU4717168.1 metal-dependent hydrolase [Halapricum hydrolyticum]MCU4726095.1 metal-dependent hydrolase [Halapricum hydrolyticum]
MVSSGQAAFLAIAIATHGAVGYTLGKALFDRPIAGLLAGVAPDVDFLFPNALGWPFVHRGVTHTLLVGGLVVGFVAYRNRRTATAVAVAYGSHLLIDTTTPKGVPHLYPLVETNYHLGLGTTGHSPVPTAVTWVCCLIALWLVRDERLDVTRF